MGDEGRINNQIVLRELPGGQLSVDTFEQATGAVPSPAEGEVLCRTLLLSIDAANRAWMQGATYRGALSPGQVMDGFTLARVEESRADGLAVGEIVECQNGWQDYAVHPARAVAPLEVRGELSHHLGVLGLSGLTAYHGLLDVGRPRPGQTVVTSAAAGAAGNVAAQIARISGCRSVGIAGSDEKCLLLTERLGLDAAVNHRSPDFRADLKAACPDGIDVYFDNTGGEILEAVLFRMNQGGAIACCGVVSQYDTATPASGPRGVPGLLVTKRLRMEGFIVMDYADRRDHALADLAGWVADGRLVVLEDPFEGLGSAPEALVDLLAGGNVGKRYVRVAS
jgi:NADPH-dependent curcumin reductase CurA